MCPWPFAQKTGRAAGQPIDGRRCRGPSCCRWKATSPPSWLRGDEFLLREIDKSVEAARPVLARDFSSPEAYNNRLQPPAAASRHPGRADARVRSFAPEMVGTTAQPALIGAARYLKFSPCAGGVRDVHGEGLLMTPAGRAPIAQIVANSDAEQSPSRSRIGRRGAAGIEYARRLAEKRCRVIVPMVINRSQARTMARPFDGARVFFTGPLRVGPAIVGYEVQKVLAAVDWFLHRNQKAAAGPGPVKDRRHRMGRRRFAGVLCGALDPRIDAVCVERLLRLIAGTSGRADRPKRFRAA